MCKGPHKLPSQYSAKNVIGATWATNKPTVYFDDGARFTQQHRYKWNLGFKPPTPHYFFGNYDAKAIDAIYDVAEELARAGRVEEAKAHYRKEVAKLEGIKGNIESGKTVRPTRPGPAEDPDEMVLIEVVETAEGVDVHKSRGALEPVSQELAQVLIDDIRRARSETMDAPDAPGDFCYKERPEDADDSSPSSSEG